MFHTPDPPLDLRPSVIERSPDSAETHRLRLRVLELEDDVKRLKAERVELLGRLRVGGHADYVARLENEKA